jgi:hypothetical protein
MVVWNQTSVTALRQVSWASVPMEVSGQLLQRMFRDLPKGCHVDLVFETPEVREVVQACADIIVSGWDSKVYRHLASWRQLMDTWNRQGSSLTVGKFGDGGSESYCSCLRLPGSREAWQAQNDVVEQWNPTEFRDA